MEHFHLTCGFAWQIVEYFDASVVCTLLKTRGVHNWSKKTAYIMCINTIYCCIWFFFVTLKFIENTHLHRIGKIAYSWPVREFIGCVTTTILQFFLLYCEYLFTQRRIERVVGMVLNGVQCLTERVQYWPMLFLHGILYYVCSVPWIP